MLESNPDPSLYWQTHTLRIFKIVTLCEKLENMNVLEDATFHRTITPLSLLFSPNPDSLYIIFSRVYINSTLNMHTYCNSWSSVSPSAMVLTHASREESRCWPHCSSALSAASNVSGASSLWISCLNSSSQFVSFKYKERKEKQLLPIIHLLKSNCQFHYMLINRYMKHLVQCFLRDKKKKLIILCTKLVFQCNYIRISQWICCR